MAFNFNKILMFFVVILLFCSCVSASNITTYVYGSSGLAAKVSDDNVEFAVSDRLRSTSGLVDQDGVVVAEFKSLPFGQEIVNDGVRFSFTGKELDSSGLHYFGARYYDSATGRFTSTDPVADNHAYVYVANNPLRFVDPTGTTKEEVRAYLHYSLKAESTKFGKPALSPWISIAFELIPNSVKERVIGEQFQSFEFVAWYLSGMGGIKEIELTENDWAQLSEGVTMWGSWEDSTDPHFPAEDGWEISPLFRSDISSVFSWDILGHTHLVRKKTGIDENDQNTYFFGIYGENFDFVGSDFSSENKKYKDEYCRSVPENFIDLMKAVKPINSLMSQGLLEIDESLGNGYDLHVDKKFMETHGSSVRVFGYIDDFNPNKFGDNLWNWEKEKDISNPPDFKD